MGMLLWGVGAQARRRERAGGELHPRCRHEHRPNTSIAARSTCTPSPWPLQE